VRLARCLINLLEGYGRRQAAFLRRAAAPSPASATPVQLSVLSARGKVKTAQGGNETMGRATR
jgi:hypothetical protein